MTEEEVIAVLGNPHGFFTVEDPDYVRKLYFVEYKGRSKELLIHYDKSGRIDHIDYPPD
jgi:hypothetical protein